jgi:SpoVK/Ycf46/Vps4 family AAA+-type ATPase
MYAVTDINHNSCFSSKLFPAFALILSLTAREVERAFQPESPLLANGLFGYDDDGELSISGPLQKMINLPRPAGRDFRSLVLEKKAKAKLTRENFAHLKKETYDDMVRLLGGALEKRAEGVNLLLYGPPGTGKTELAKTLCAEIKADLYPVSEASTDNRQVSRASELQMARTLVAGDPKAILLFDEAEDVFCQHYFKEKKSKLYFNRMLERNATPVIWITNHIGYMDRAYIRRFSFVVKMETPDTRARARIWRGELAREKVKMSEPEIQRLARNYKLPPAYTTSAIRTARLIGDNGAIERTLNSHEQAITGRRKIVKEEKKVDFNPALLNTDTDLGKLTKKVLDGRPNFSLCLFGPPGTGKSEYARHLADKMGLEVLHKRAGDILSPWVDKSEQNIAAAFEEAREEKKMLIFDEAESFLQDRRGAGKIWEVTQVNEMLTWMESHPYPFACTTNLMDKLDPASLRRFTFKVKYDYLTREQARLAFRHFFGLDYDVKLEALTPGDFAVVARKAAIMGLDDPAELVAMLALEQEAKGVKSTAIGFQV